MDLSDASTTDIIARHFDKPARHRPVAGLSPWQAHPGPSVFLHTGWRSGGTWIWSRCRDLACVQGFYEPLHEQAAQFRRRDVAIMRPGSWQSNHSHTAPYFEEFRDLIPPTGRGVANYQERFAFDGFFRAPTEAADPELVRYLQSLLAHGFALGRVPVLKFCRSLGRVGWLEQLFPQALHAVVLRDPIAQFASAQTLLQEQRNRYFALAPVLVLARNAQHPLVREAASALGVSLPPLFSDDLDYAVETVWRQVRRASAEERYRAFLAFWTLSTMTALDSQALVIDMSSIGGDAAHRHAAEAALRSAIGEPIQLIPRAQGKPVRPPPAGYLEAHRAAATLVRGHRNRLSSERLDVILAKLDVGQSVPAGRRSWKPAILPPPPPETRPKLHRLGTWAMVRFARALQPLRRLHGAVVARSS